jgi:hypothetical protein
LWRVFDHKCTGFEVKLPKIVHFDKFFRAKFST